MTAAYIDEYRNRFGIGPICRVLGKSLDCGFLTPRGYRMFKSRPVSRMAARHEALARDILAIHADSFMAVYGYRKTHAQLLAQGWDPGEVGGRGLRTFSWRLSERIIICSVPRNDGARWNCISPRR